MIKRILKILGIVLACFVGACGAGVGIYALQGGFEEVKIDIINLYFDDTVADTNETTFSVNDSLTNQTIYTLSDVTTSVQFTPLDATDKKLAVEVTGVDGVLENKEELERGITAGENFTLKIRKDALGNNHGGVVNLTIKSPNELAEVSITLIVDVPIPDNSMYFTGSEFSGAGNDKVTANGNMFTLSKNNTQSYIYLKSQLYNAFYLPVSEQNIATGSGNLKSTTISYSYKTLKGEIKTYEYSANELKIENVYDSQTHTYSYCYKVPVVPNESGTITFTAKTHRSYTIQKEFQEKGFKDLKTIIAYQNLTDENRVKARQMKASFTEFVNKYISYFDDTEASYNFFRECVGEDGKIKFETDDSLLEALDNYVFVSCSTDVEVTAVNLSKIEATSDAKTYNVFNTVDFSKSKGLMVDGRVAKNVYEEFDLKITLNDADGEVYEGTAEEENVLFDTLDMDAYLYIQAEGVDDEENLTDAIPVYGFKDGQPVTPLIWETLSVDEQAEYFDGESYLIIGYLHKITSGMRNNKFMEVGSGVASDDKYWTANFNVPFQEEKGETEITKALFFRFSVTGVDIKTAKNISREAFTRVYITYTEYEYASTEEEHLNIKSVDDDGKLTNFNTTMALNTELTNNLNNSGDDIYALNSQNLAIDTSSDAILNYNGSYSNGSKVVPQVEYKSVMYFVEATSNETTEGDAKQVVSVGRYNFYNMSGTPYTYGGEDALLEGQRIPTYNMVNGRKQFYVQTLNASGLDETGLDRSVEIFAVVYLSDKDGNPISLNGEKILIDETSADAIATLYVIAMSSVSNFTNIVIHNVVDNVNFYTTMASAITACEDVDYSIGYGQGEWVKRNYASSFTYNDGTVDYEVTGTSLTNYNNFLKLKLLKNKDFKLYVTNFEMDREGNIADSDGASQMNIVGLDGSTQLYEFTIKTISNKQVAFNELCKNLQSYYSLSQIDDVNVDKKADFQRDEVTGDYKYFVYTINASDNATTGKIYNVSLKASGIPYSNRAEQNYVKLEVNEIAITDVSLGDDINRISQSVSLSAKYMDRKNNESVAKGQVQFYQQNETNSTPYSGYSINNISYSVATNLVRVENGANVINVDVVDPSQAIYQSGGNLLEDSVGEDIYNYIYYYTKSSLGAGISYSLVSNFAILQNEMKFTISDDGLWHIGDKTYEDSQVVTGTTTVDEDGKIMKFLELDGVRYFEDFKVTGEDASRVITYPVNSYFPVVSRDGENYMLAFGTEFLLYTRDGHTLFKHSSLGNSQESAVILPTNFGLDGVEENGKNVQYETKSYISISGVGKNQTYNLIKGEDHTDKYYRDTNGLYKFEGGKFSLAETGYTGDRYSISDDTSYGVMAYVFINFGFIPTKDGNSSYAVNLTKVLSFNLIQNELKFKMVVNGRENSSSNRIIVAGGGKKVSISINPNASETDPTTTGIFTNDPNIVGHLDIEHSIDGVDIRYDEVSNKIVVETLKNFGGSQEIQNTFKISYIFKGKTISHEYYLAITPNYNFNFGGTFSDDSYIMDLDAFGISKTDYERVNSDGMSKYDLMSILGVINENAISEGVLNGSYGFSSYKLTLMTVDKNKEPATFDGTYLNVGTLYSADLTNKNEYYMMFKIVLMVNGEEEELTRSLRVEFNPTYKVKFEDWSSSDSIDVYNGEDIYNRIKVYGYNENSANYTVGVNNLSVIKNAIKVTTSTTGVNITNGVIDAYGTGHPKSDNTMVTLKVVYGKTESAYKELRVNVVGIKMYYSSTGNVDNDANRVELNSNISIETSESIDISNYIKFTTSDGKELDVILKEVGNETNAIYGGTVEPVSKIYKIYVGLNDSGSWSELADTTLTLSVSVPTTGEE